jgi:hypothetical protein
LPAFLGLLEDILDELVTSTKDSARRISELVNLDFDSLT